MGKLLVMQGRHEEAIENLKRAIEIQSDYAFAYYNLAKAYQDIRDFPNAIYNLMFALNYEPDDVYAINVLGRMFLEVGLNDRALRTFQQVIDEFDVNDKFALFGKAEALTAMGRFNQAQEVLMNLRNIAAKTDKNMLNKIDDKLTKLKREMNA
ncbi:MAG: tetratricopeptide repeat protein [Candidatus Riflebacteria bacterium]